MPRGSLRDRVAEWRMALPGLALGGLGHPRGLAVDGPSSFKLQSVGLGREDSLNDVGICLMCEYRRVIL